MSSRKQNTSARRAAKIAQRRTDRARAQAISEYRRAMVEAFGDPNVALTFNEALRSPFVAAYRSGKVLTIDADLI